MGLLEYRTRLTTIIKHQWAGPHHHDLVFPHHHPHPALWGVDVQIRWLLGAMAVEPGLLDIGDGLGSSGDACDASEPPNKPMGVHGGAAEWC